MNNQVKTVCRIIAFAGIAILPMIAWLITDAGLPHTIVGLREIYQNPNSMGASLYEAVFRESKEHGIRKSLAVGAVVIWFVMLGISTWRMRFRLKKTNASRQTLRWSSMLVVGIHVLALFLVWLSADQLMHIGLRLRAEQMREKLTLVSEELFKQWPSKVGKYNETESLGRVIPLPKEPNRLFVLEDDDSGSFTEGMGYSIERDPQGDMLLILLSSCQSSTARLNAVICRKQDVNAWDRQWLEDVGVDWETRTPFGKTMYLVTVIGGEPK